jgi:hypothetical protein
MENNKMTFSPDPDIKIKNNILDSDNINIVKIDEIDHLILNHTEYNELNDSSIILNDEKQNSSENEMDIVASGKDFLYNLEITDYSYFHPHNDNSKPSPYKEILRYHNINGLNECFQLKLKELDSSIYDVNELFKNDSCKLIELINRWCWHQYNSPNSVDYLIPYVSDNKYDYERFIDDLNYILNVHGSEHAIKSDDKIMIGLNKFVSDYLEIEYNNYSSRNNIDLKVTKDYVEKKVRLTCSYKKSSYQVIIHSKVYSRLKIKLIMFGKNYNIMSDYYDDLDNLLDQYIFCLVFRYSYMDSGNQQLAIHQSIKDMYKKCGVNFELFGSAINTISTNYCSLFYDIEKYFGSNGSFFDIKLDSGIYWCNPPYDDTIMTNTANKLVEFLDSDKEVAFLVTIPIWDVYTQNKMKESNTNDLVRNYNTETDSSFHKDFKIYSKLKPYIKDELIIPKHRIPYFNYKKYSNINAVNTYMLIIYKKINPKVAENLHYNFDKIVELDKENFFCRNC